MATSLSTATPLLVVGDTGGITVIDPATPLKRLNYFDGKYLRADDFDVEQGYLRQLVALSNQGLGGGVVYGYDTTLGSGDSVQIGPGLAIDPMGRVLLMQKAVTQGIQALIDATAKTAATTPDASGKIGGFSDCVEVAAPPATTTVVQSGDLYVIAICAAEALCGQQDVFGIACQDACVTTTDRPYRLDGVVLRAIPLQLVTPFPSAKAVAIDADLYLRAKVAHSWFADEVLRHPSAISGAGLQTQVWCLGAGYRADCCEVPLAVVARNGATTRFLDAWIVRRERIDAPARRYWQWKMRMRPWDVYLAQILQFQCQLADAFAAAQAQPPAGAAAAHQALSEAAQFVAQVRSGLASVRSADSVSIAGRPALLTLSMTGIADLQSRLSAVLQTGVLTTSPSRRVLIARGIVETPPGGYLWVATGTALSVNDQVRALLGDGVDLRFCIVRADYVAHAIEEAQHMDRISLIEGLDDPAAKPKVDVWVPDGIATREGVSGLGLYDATLQFSAQQTGGLAYKGAARELRLATGGTALYSAQAGISQVVVTKMQTLAKAIVAPTARTKATTVSANLYDNAFVAKSAALGAQLDVKVSASATQARSFVTAGNIAAGGGTIATAAQRASSATETIDGLWIDARIDDEVASLGAGGHSAVRLRAVIASRPATPIAIDLSFTGTLTITGASTATGSLALGGRLNGVLAFGMLKEDQAKQSTVEYQLTERYDWPVTVSYVGTSGSGSVTMDIALASAQAKNPITLRVVKTTAGNGVQIDYQIALVTPAAATNPNANASVVPLGRLNLAADAAIVDPANGWHQYAENGLVLLQAALIVSEPNLKAQAESLLFPAAQAQPELIIKAVRDWVAFTRRRERLCAPDLAPTQPLPPRRYRVVEVTAGSRDEAQSMIAALQQAKKDPVALAKIIDSLIAVAGRDAIRLVVSYAGGSAAATSDLGAAELDWKSFKPGHDILYAAIGAIGETDAALQLARLATFKAAIKPDSVEVKGAPEDVLLPYPEAAVPDDADGVMVLVTVTAVVARSALLIYGNWDRPNHFVNIESPNANASFADNVAQGTVLHDFIAALTPNQPVLGVTLATTKAAPDAGATTRLQAVIAALGAAGRPTPAASRQTVQAINDHDRQQVIDAGHDPAAVDEVIFFELNAGT